MARGRWPEAGCLECRLGARDLLANQARSAHGINDAGDDLRDAGPLAIARGLRFEQLRVRKNDPQLVIELMKQRPQLDVRRWTIHAGMKRHAYA